MKNAELGIKEIKMQRWNSQCKPREEDGFIYSGLGGR